MDVARLDLASPWGMVVLLTLAFVVLPWAYAFARRALRNKEYIPLEGALSALQIDQAKFAKLAKEASLPVRLKVRRGAKLIRRSDFLKVQRHLRTHYGADESRLPYDLTLAYLSAFAGAAVSGLDRRRSGDRQPRYGPTLAVGPHWKLIEWRADRDDEPIFLLVINPQSYATPIDFWRDADSIGRKHGIACQVVIHLFLPWLLSVDRSALTIGAELAEFEAGGMTQRELLWRIARKSDCLPAEGAFEALRHAADQQPVGLAVLQCALQGLSTAKIKAVWLEESPSPPPAAGRPLVAPPKLPGNGARK